MIYGQKPAINIPKPFVEKNDLSSWIIGTCRNHVYNQVTQDSNAIIDIYNETKFAEKQQMYRNVKPVFGSGRKLYRLGGNHIDGSTEYGGSNGFVWNYDYDSPPTNGQYPYDNLIHYIEEAIEMDADLLIGINVANGTAESAAELVEYLTDLQVQDPITNEEIDVIDRVAYFELGNELPAGWIKNGCQVAANPMTYCDYIAPFISQMRAKNSNIKIALMDGYNLNFDWGSGCSNWACNDCGPLEVVNTYLNYTDGNGQPLDFDYIAFHAYPDGWRFPHSGGSGQTTCGNGDIVKEFNLLMAANQWFYKNHIDNGNSSGQTVNDLLLADDRGIRLVNTEFSTAYAFSDSDDLNSHGIVQALYTADNILTSIVADIPTVIAFSYLGSADFLKN